MRAEKTCPYQTNLLTLDSFGLYLGSIISIPTSTSISTYGSLRQSRSLFSSSIAGQPGAQEREYVNTA